MGRWGVSRAAALALMAGLLLTAALALTALALYEHNETRLLKLRARELGSVLSAAVPSLETPLASAAELADATRGNPQKFKAFIAPYVGRRGEFVSASLWTTGAGAPAPHTVVGAPPALASHPAEAQRFFHKAQASKALEVVGILGTSSPSLGYAFGGPAAPGGYAAYAESRLPKNRRSKIASQSAFSDLNYALFLGHTRKPSALLVTNLHRFPVTGRQASDVVPFGDSAFTLVVTPNGSLGGGFFESLPWIIGLLGLLVTLAAGAVTERLVRRRLFAEGLASDLDRVATENRQLYTEQRGIAETLQHALLPDALPELRGMRAKARYVPAGHGLDVGGDWYDVLEVDDQRALLVIGDVSGHGLAAATTMASLRHAALAYAADGCGPSELLARLANFGGTGAREHFATVLCAMLERDEHRVSVASAGHLPPLLRWDSQARFLEFAVGPPIGVLASARYEESGAHVEPHSILLAYTDGLVERRGEMIDVGLERLREASLRDGLDVEELLGRLTEELSSRQDDTAIVGIEWQS